MGEKMGHKKTAHDLAEESLGIANRPLKIAEDAKKTAAEIAFSSKRGVWLFINLPWNKLKASKQVVRADAYYYLPTASLVVSATAKVLTTKTADGLITS